MLSMKSNAKSVTNLIVLRILRFCKGEKIGKLRDIMFKGLSHTGDGVEELTNF